MDNSRVLIAMDENTFKNVLNEMFEKKTELKAQPEFEAEKLSKKQAVKLIGCTQPTLNKLIKEGKFKQYSLGSRKYLLKSEVIESLRKNS